MIHKIHKISLLNKWSLWFKSMKREANMKVIKKIMLEMEEESSFIKMEAIMMDNGEIIKCMAGASFTMKVENWLMKEIGLMISFTAMEKYIMIILFRFHHLLDLTTQTLIYLMTIGNIMKVCWLQTLNREEEGSS